MEEKQPLHNKLYLEFEYTILYKSCLYIVNYNLFIDYFK